MEMLSKCPTYPVDMFPDHLGLENRPLSLPKRSNSSLCKFEIISEDMANNGAFLDF
jgi:hypothetical protein